MDTSLKAIFGMDGAGFRADLKQTMAEARSAVNNWANIVTGVGVAAVVALSKGAIDLAGHLSDTSQNLGINVVSLQALEAQHKRNGVSQEELTKALQKTRQASIDAFNGDKKQAEALATLHLTASQFIALPLDKQYAAIGRSLATATDKNAAYNAVSTLFGEKIGPKLMASLKELGEQGLPKVTAEAQKMGQVMSAETIAALDRAGDAIDDFKKRATVAIGNLIVNFRTEEGLYLLYLQFVKIGHTFAAKILDAISEANDFLGAVFKGTFASVVAFFRDTFLTNIATLATQINKILPKKFEIDVGKIESLKSAGLSIGENISAAIANTKPSTFTKDVATYWDKAIADQQKVVNGLNKVDLGKDAKKLTDAGKDMERSGKAAASSLVEAGKTVAQELQSAAAIVHGIGRTGKDPEQLTTGQLEALQDNIRKNLFSTRQADQSVLSVTAGAFGGGYKSPQQYLLEQEAARVQAELDLRRRYSRDYSLGGQGRIDRNYAPTDADRLKSLTGLNTIGEQTNQKLETLTDLIERRLPTGAIDTLNKHLEQGVRTVITTG